MATAHNLDFQDDRQNHRPLGGLFVEVTLQVGADLLLDDAPVEFSRVLSTTSRAELKISAPSSEGRKPRVTISGGVSSNPVCLLMTMIGTTTPSSDKWRRSRITTSSISSSDPESTMTRPAWT